MQQGRFNVGWYNNENKGRRWCIPVLNLPAVHRQPNQHWITNNITILYIINMIHIAFYIVNNQHHHLHLRQHNPKHPHHLHHQRRQEDKIRSSVVNPPPPPISLPGGVWCLVFGDHHSWWRLNQWWLCSCSCLVINSRYRVCTFLHFAVYCGPWTERNWCSW